jgi:hypothetical protein
MSCERSRSNCGVALQIIYVPIAVEEARRRLLANRRTRVRNDVRDEDFELVLARFEPPDGGADVVRHESSLNRDAGPGAAHADGCCFVTPRIQRTRLTKGCSTDVAWGWTRSAGRADPNLGSHLVLGR